MKKFFIKLFIFFCFISLALPALAVDFNVRITREEFAEFYGALVIEEEYKDLPLDDIFSSGFDPITGKLKGDELFSVRSPYFGPDIFKKQEKPGPQLVEETVETEKPQYKSVVNLKLSANTEPAKNTLNEKLLAANKFIKTGEYRNALDLLYQAKQLAPNNYKILYTYAITLYKNDEFDQAESNLLRVTQIKPGFMYAHYNLGNIYYKKQEYKKALDSFKKAMELAPDNADIYFNIALTLEALGYKEMAGKFYSKCLELNPNDDEAYKAIQRLN